MAQNLQILKYMILGEDLVGKTCLLMKYCQNRFEPKYEKSKGLDFQNKMFENENLKLVIFDTPGDESYKFASDGFYKFTYGFVLLFDLRNPDSLYVLAKEIAKIETTAPKGAQMILVGNMSDLEFERRVNYEEAAEFAKSYNIPYIEISCLTGNNVDLAFEDLTKRVLEQVHKGIIILPQKLVQNSGNGKDQEDVDHKGGCYCNIF